MLVTYPSGLSGSNVSTTNDDRSFSSSSCCAFSLASCASDSWMARCRSLSSSDADADADGGGRDGGLGEEGAAAAAAAAPAVMSVDASSWGSKWAARSSLRRDSQA